VIYTGDRERRVKLTSRGIGQLSYPPELRVLVQIGQSREVSGFYKS
jgi:hypothetical protein